MKFIKSLTLAEVARVIDADLEAEDHKASVNSIGKIDGGNAGEIAFLINPKYGKFLATTNCTAVIIEPNYSSRCKEGVAKLITKNPKLALARLVELCINKKELQFGVHKTASISKSATISQKSIISANVVISDNATIGDNVTIHPGVCIGENVTVGTNTIIYPNAVVYDNSAIGENCIIHAGVVIGSDGFGFANNPDGSWVKMPHLGKVVIGNNVEIGSNTTIDRGFMHDTTIGDGVIIDNLVQIGHNVQIGDHTAIAGCVGIAGTVKIGKNCMIGGKTAIAGHIEICDRVLITGGSGLNRSITKPGIYSSGMPVKENAKWRKNITRFYQLDDMAKRIKQIEKSLEPQQS